MVLHISFHLIRYPRICTAPLSGSTIPASVAPSESFLVGDRLFIDTSIAASTAIVETVHILRIVHTSFYLPNLLEQMHGNTMFRSHQLYYDHLSQHVIARLLSLYYISLTV